jgi:hypothetical protein
MLAGAEGAANQLAMRVIVTMAELVGGGPAADGRLRRLWLTRASVQQ